MQKLYCFNPLMCSKYSGSNKIIFLFIEDEQFVKYTLKRMDLWDVKRKPPPRANRPPTEAFIIDDGLASDSTDDYIIEVDFPIDLSRRSSTCWVVAESEA